MLWSDVVDLRETIVGVVARGVVTRGVVLVALVPAAAENIFT